LVEKFLKTRFPVFIEDGEHRKDKGIGLQLRGN
jgi:hypothetical protein